MQTSGIGGDVCAVTVLWQKATATPFAEQCAQKHYRKIEIGMLNASELQRRLPPPWQASKYAGTVAMDIARCR
eukprot:6498067-Pyramimonas_sp.AAC.1